MENMIRDVQSGDKASAEKLVRLYYDEIYVYVYKLTYDKDKSMDLTQEIFIRVLNKINKYKEKNGTFKSWLYKVAHNYVINYFKSKEYKESKRYIEIPEYLSSDINIDNSFLKNEEKILINKQLFKLEDKYKDVIIMKYYQDLSIDEIAALLELNDNTVKTRLRRGIGKLKDCLEGGDFNEYK